MTALILHGSNYSFENNDYTLGSLLILVFDVALVVFLIRRYFYLSQKEKDNYKSAMNQYNKLCKNTPKIIEHNKRYNKEVVQAAKDKRDSDLVANNQQWEKRNNYLKNEYNKVVALLDSYYEMNIIPNQYRRNFSAVYYLYDWMSSTQDSLRDTLFHSHIEDGIRRIEGQMRQITNQLERNIYETRCLRDQNQEIGYKVDALISKNSSMLRSLEQTAQNSAEAAQYAELASNYSKANAYFSLANYFNN